MELEPGQPVFMKEVHGNVWKPGVIDQPAKEPDSYWIKFPDSSILRRTRSMIKSRSLPSHFELQAEGKERNSTEFIPLHVHSIFNSLLLAPEQPMGNLVVPPMTEMGTLSAAGNIPLVQPSLPSQAVDQLYPVHQGDPPMQTRVFHQ